jgi:hypothetical protein
LERISGAISVPTPVRLIYSAAKREGLDNRCTENKDDRDTGHDHPGGRDCEGGDGDRNDDVNVGGPGPGEHISPSVVTISPPHAHPTVFTFSLGFSLPFGRMADVMRSPS